MADDFALEVRELLKAAEEADKDNRDEAITDLKFEAGEQWHKGVRQEREAKNLPCPTINVAQQYTSQIVGDWRANQTSIKVLPREDGDVTIADVRSELIRSIELQSKASRIYASSLGQMVACGVSNFRIDVDYAYEDAFERDIFIRDIPDPLAVRWDPLSFDHTGRDATYCFVGDQMSEKEYERRFPKAAKPSLFDNELRGTSWYQNDTVLVPEYWKIDERLRTIGMTFDGKTVDLTEIPRNKWPRLLIDPQTNAPVIREKAKCKYAVMVMTNGMEPLSDPYEAKLPRLPIIKVTGREIFTGEKRVRFGLLRFMRDSILMRNHNRAIRSELLMRFPRANFFGPASAIDGREADWENYLAYNDGTQPPQEITGRNLAALIAEEQFYAQDLMDVTGIHEASKGMPSNETSGVAIRARQSEGDIATIVYHDHMLDAQQEGGEVINAYIDQVFDTARTIRAVGPDLGAKMVRINDPNHPNNVDIGLGKYDVTVSTGPTYATRRQEGAAQLMELVAKAPQVAEVGGDIIISEMDLINGDKLAERVKRAMPPQVLGDDADDGKSDEEKQAQAEKAAEAEQVQKMGLMLEMRGKKADADLKEAQAMKAQADAQKAMAEAQGAGQGEAGPDPMLAMQELRLKSALADEAEANAALAQAQATSAMLALANGGDPESMQRLQIEAENAITKRIIALNPHILQANEPPEQQDEAA